MTDLLPRVEAMLQGIVEEKVRDATRAACDGRDKATAALRAIVATAGVSQHVTPQTDYAELAVLDVALLKKWWTEACTDRDKAVRDAQALREQVQALELKLLEVRKVRKVRKVAAQPLEVDGFRVGDLVRHGALGTSNLTILRFKRKGATTYAHIDNHTGGWSTRNLTRKPVEVGDRVRSVLSDQQAQVFSGDAFAWDVRLPHGQVVKWSRDACIAIAK